MRNQHGFSQSLALSGSILTHISCNVNESKLKEWTSVSYWFPSRAKLCIFSFEVHLYTVGKMGLLTRIWESHSIRCNFSFLLGATKFECCNTYWWWLFQIYFFHIHWSWEPDTRKRFLLSDDVTTLVMVHIGRKSNCRKLTIEGTVLVKMFTIEVSCTKHIESKTHL